MQTIEIRWHIFSEPPAGSTGRLAVQVWRQQVGIVRLRPSRQRDIGWRRAKTLIRRCNWPRQSARPARPSVALSRLLWQIYEPKAANLHVPLLLVPVVACRCGQSARPAHGETLAIIE